MKWITKALAAQMEECLKQTHIEVTRSYQEGAILEISGGAACFSGYDSYLSQVVGWGFSTQPQQFKSEIETIEDFTQGLNHTRIDIEFCPFAGNDLAIFLNQRGYGITEMNNVSVLDLSAYDLIEFFDRPFDIKILESSRFNEWATQTALGFGYPEAKSQFVHYAQAKGVKVFAVFEQNELIAGATLALHGTFCVLAVTSTLPLYRNKGLQKQLLQARLNFAKKQGLSFAIVTTEPGSISDANVQKVGFHCAYTRIKMTKFVSP